jgi:hypothetical protein
MRDELAGGGPGPGGDPAPPPWPPPGPRAPVPADPQVTFGRRAPGPGHAAGGSRARRSRGRRWLRLMLLAGLLAGLAGLTVSAGAAVIQFLPRNFSPAQRQQIMAWEVAKRWRTWPAGRIFPPAIAYELPGSAFGGGASLSLAAERVGIAGQAPCRDATGRSAGRALSGRGCLAVLRATYEDTTQTFAVTVGIAVLPSAAGARASAASLKTARPPLARAVSFRRTATAHFAGPGGKLGWSVPAGPYVVLATVGYADGRPWIRQGHDGYTQAEMMSLASGVGGSIAARLGAAPPVPHCPGSPGC